ncbi:zinc finger protein 543-like [Diachasmimorpha longicaudata]|uniref:zinc finger protein 543-like n=1 Tax=Diachasmimorpha longicaudata TaxID=58733 RepID=UPI0030B91646
MSDDSEILGRRPHSPRTLTISKSPCSEDNWFTSEPETTLVSNDCQRNVQLESTNPWISENKERNCDLGEVESMIIASRGWNGYHTQVAKNEESSKSPRPKDSPRPHPKTVEDIEQWLKTRPDAPTTMEPLKQELETVDRYLTSPFLEKDQDVLSIDIDYTDKKLTLGYDPSYDQFQELHNEKYLEVCKDGFTLPEFPLDNLDPLTLANNDMMVAGEVLPSTSTQPEDYAQEPEETSQHPSSEVEQKPSIPDFALTTSQEVDEIEISPEIDPLIHEDLGSLDSPSEGDISPPNGKSESRIVKKRRKVLKIEDNRLQYDEEDVQTDNKDGIMAVVAISTDKISNMTQIVINTGKEEQIYQGKTSELMEATGYFPNIAKMEGGGCWREAGSTSHEMIITNALEELGFTEEGLVSLALVMTENGKTWICPKEECRREFNRLYALKGHLLAHYGVRPFKCDYDGCAWAFHSDFKLKRHKETHLKRKDYVCQVCNRRFTTIYNLWTHEKLHSRPNRIACLVPSCLERFQTKRALEIHMKSHDQEHAPYVCSHEGCGKRYYSSNALSSHQRCHSYKEVDIKCGWLGCGKVFDKPCRLKAHVRCHTGSKPYSCTYPGCGWAFSSSSKLKRHEKKHTNERKFLCEFPGCNKAFMRSEHLKEHRLTHKEGRFFQCYMCDASFSAKSSLYVHIKKHQNRENNGSVQNARARVGLMERRLEDSESVKTICEELSMKSVPSVPEDLHGGLSPLQNVGKIRGEEDEVCKRIGSSKMLRNRDNGHSDLADSSELNYVLYEDNDQGEGGQGEEGAEPEPEPPPKIVGNVARGRRGQGAARTRLTCDDVWRMKRRNSRLNSVGPSDVVLGGGDIGEGLLLEEELPLMFYQEDLGNEGQILLLEGGSEETIGLRGLE